MKQYVPFLLLPLALISCSSEHTELAKNSPEYQQLAAANIQKGRAFLEKNATKPGVIVLTSGLQYTILRQGNGPISKADGYVTVDYRGITLDGKEFDSSYARGKPMIFQLNRVIPGWTEALQLMQEGAKWKLFIPSHLGYGEYGAGSAIGPNETLIFEVELLKVH